MGATLRAVRKIRTDLSLEKAARLLQWSLAKMSRFENGKCHITSDDVAAVTAVYRIPVAERNTLIQFATHGDQTVWWDPPLPGIPHEMSALSSYFDDANTITDWSATLIPGLLQIEGYAKALLLAAGRTPGEAHTA
ncbi:hypothetical protein BLA60_20945 [Actinophytocola xinjiangensis]|uniref:HTH cro/C1-type domain-containing protein n=1 Tax=Actinophytocola xinjiangensis TaxID=485602 RepID=A0A7Z0WJX3_9PSEU|nr:hypothetical protein BLA60_20945 [Actinophytocola xinjiangensis]